MKNLRDLDGKASLARDLRALRNFNTEPSDEDIAYAVLIGSTVSPGAYNHWSEEEDRELISLLWTGARGKDRVLPGRIASSCKKRLQRIHNHIDKAQTCSPSPYTTLYSEVVFPKVRRQAAAVVVSVVITQCSVVITPNFSATTSCCRDESCSAAPPTAKTLRPSRPLPPPRAC